MIFSNQNKNVKSTKSWKDYYSKKIVESVNINGDLPVIIAGVVSEKVFAWDTNNHKFSNKVKAQAIWIVQDVKANGHLYYQNPIKVEIQQTDLPQLVFGQKVKLQNLLGYYSKKNHRYYFKAENVKVIDNA